MLAKRIITGIVGGALTIFVIYEGKLAFFHHDDSVGITGMV
jgi:hypothetical protein